MQRSLASLLQSLGSDGGKGGARADDVGVGAQLDQRRLARGQGLIEGGQEIPGPLDRLAEGADRPRNQRNGAPSR